jgi:hypothetical protein
MQLGHFAMEDLMLDFTLVNKKESTMQDLVSGLNVEDLRQLTNEMIDTMLRLVEDLEDDDVVFIPNDPDAYDAAAATDADVELAWTLGHVIVHTTATSEEAGAIAAELARGVPHREGRSRYETPWESVLSISQCQDRLKESRRMRLASLDMWPDNPALSNSLESRSGKRVNALYRFVAGLRHDDSHLVQISKIAEQARVARRVQANGKP